MLLIIIFFAPLRYYLYKYSFYDKLYENNRVYQVLDSNDVDRITKDIFAFFKKMSRLRHLNCTAMLFILIMTR